MYCDIETVALNMFRVFSVNLFVIVKADSCSELTEVMLEGFKAVYNTSYSYVMLLTNYYYWYSALGPVWADTRAQSGDWYVSGTLHPGQILRGSLPLLSPAF